MRTIEEITVDAGRAIDQRTSTVLLTYADEVLGLGTDAALALSDAWRGDAARYRGDFNMAIECYNSALAYYTHSGTALQKANVQFTRAIAFANTNEYEAALRNYEMALDTYINEGRTKQVVSVYGNIGVIYERRAQFEKSMEYHALALAQQSEESNPSSYAFITQNLGVVNSRMGRFTEALELFHKSLSIFESLDEKYSIGIALGNLAIVHRTNGNYTLAVDYYSRALQVCEEIEDHVGVAITKGNVGSLYAELGDKEKSLTLLRQAADTHKAMGSKIGDASVIASLASVLANSGRLDEALESFAYSLALHRELGNTPGVVHILCNICLALIDNGRPEDVHPYLDELLGLTIDSPVNKMECSVILGRLAVLNADYDAGVEHYTRALNEAVEHDLRSGVANTHEALRDLAQLRGDFAAYVKHNMECISIREEINGKEASIKMALFSKENEMKEIEKEHQKHMAVLHSTLPKHIADRVARGEVVNDKHECVAVVFLDLVGFTTMSSSMDATDVVALLERIFALCDATMSTHGLMKIKTIGDSYMAVAFDNIHNAALAALELATAITEVPVRIGIHCGPVVAGVLGKERMQYDVWGDTVNIASRKESTSEPGRVHVSAAFAKAVEEKNVSVQSREDVKESRMLFVERGEIAVKGKGMMSTFWLEQS
ncbi:hypothetical protein BH10BAC6_BH10BAC6_05800 [soil metagenome]